MALIESLNVGLNLSTGAFSKGIKQAQGSLSGFKSSITGVGGAIAGLGALIGAGAIIASLKSLTQESMQAIDTLDEFAGSIGQNTQELSSLHFAAQMLGADGELVNASLVKMMKGIGDANAGSKGAAAAFEELGLNAEQLAQQSPVGSFKAIAGAISELPTASDRAAAAMGVFGKSGATLLPMIDAGAEGISEFQKEAERLGITFNSVEAGKVAAANDAIDRMGTLMTSLGQQMAIQLAPIIETVATKFTEVASSGMSMGDVVRVSLEYIGKAIGLVADVVHTLGIGFKFLQATITTAISWSLEPLRWLYKGVTELLTLLGADVDTTLFDSISHELDNLAKEQFKEANEALLIDPPSTKINQFFSDLTTESKKAAEAIAEPKKAIDAVSESMVAATDDAAKLIEKLQAQIDTFGMSSTEAELFKLKTEGVSEALLSEARALQATIDKMEADASAKKEMQSAIEQTIKDTRTPIEEFDARVKELNEQLAAGLPRGAFDKAVKEAQETLKNELPEAEETGSGEVQLAGAALAGSAAARSTILRNQLGNNNPMKKLTETNEEQLAEQKLTRIAIERLVEAQTDDFVTVSI